MSEALKIKIKAAREKAGLTQKQLAEKLGIPLPTVIAWENNQRTPKGLSLLALNAALDEILSA